MAIWTNEVNPFGQNRTPLLIGLSKTDGITTVPVAVDPTNGQLQVNTSGGGGGGTSSTYGAAFPTTGTAAGASDGTNMQPLLVDGSGNLKVSGSFSVGGTTDEAAFTAGTSTFTSSGGVYNDTVANLTAGQQGAQRLTIARALHTNLRNASGTEIGTSTTPVQVSLANTATNSTAVKVDGSTVTQPISATSLPLPSGAATSANQTNNSQTTQIVNSSGNPITSTNVNGTIQSLNVFVENATSGSLLGRVNLYDSTNTNAAAVNGAGALTISNTAFTANAGTNLNTSLLALESGGNLDDIDAALDNVVAQETATAGLKGLEVFGAVTTNAPTYSTTKSDALSLDTSGLLRVSLKDTPTNTNNFNVNLAASAATITVSGTVTTTPPTNASTNITQVGGSAFALGQQLAAASLPIVLTASQLTTLTPLSTVAVTQSTASSLNAQVVGSTASGASVSGNPVQIGGLAKTALPTAVSDGQVVENMQDKFGRQVVINQTVRDLVSDQSTTITSSTAATTVVTAVASVFLDLVSLTFANTSATGTQVGLYNDDGTTLRWSGYVPPTDMRGIVFSVPFTQAAVNKTWKVITTTSVASVIVTAQTIQNK